MDSRLAVEVASALGRELDVSVNAVALFEYPTPVELACHLAESSDPASPEPVREPPGPLPPAEKLLELYEALPPDRQRLVDEAATPDEADRLILTLAAA